MDVPLGVAVAHFGLGRVAAQDGVYRGGHVWVHQHVVALLDLHQHFEGGWGAAFEHGLLRAAAAGFLVGQGDQLDAADQVGQGGVEQQVIERAAVGRADQLDTALGDGAGGQRLQLAADLVDDDDLGVVVLDRFDHHLVLERRRGDLHAAGAADGRVGHVAVAADLVGGVDDHDALVLRQNTGGLAQHGGLTDTRSAQDQHGLVGLDEILDDIDGAVHGAAHASRQADDMAAAVADARDPVEGSLQPGAVVGVEIADALDHPVDILVGDVAVAERHFFLDKSCHRLAPEVHHDLEQVIGIISIFDGLCNVRRQNAHQGL